MRKKAMREREDRRIVKTKGALFTAFLELLSEKLYEDITVNEICERADIRRATFYKHYNDKLAFFTAFTHMLRDRFDNNIWKSKATTPDYYVAYAERIVEYITENDKATENIFKSNLMPTIMNVLIEQNYQDTYERLVKDIIKGRTYPASPEVIASMCAGGVASVIYHWYATGRVKSVAALSYEISQMVSGVLGIK
jgi:AcrR family transcriptional regulator